MSDAVITPIDRPCKNEENRPFVLAMLQVSTSLERTPRMLADIARAICAANERYDEGQKERIAAELDLFALDVTFGASQLREAK